MSNIIGFPDQRRVLRDRVSAGSSAEILFFTGVRYERQGEPDTKSGLRAGIKRSGTGARSPRKRKQQA